MGRLNQLSRSSQWFIALLVIFTGWSFYIANNNEYMSYKDVPVTFIDRFPEQHCYKHTCRETWVGLFKTDDGYIFDRPISAYMYRQMHLGEKFDLPVKEIDYKPTTRNNILWFFIPCAVYIITSALWIITFGWLIGSLVFKDFS